MHEERIEWLQQMLEEELAHKGTNTEVCAAALRHAIESERILQFEEETGVAPMRWEDARWYLFYLRDIIALAALPRANPNGWPTRREATLAAMRALGVEV